MQGRDGFEQQGNEANGEKMNREMRELREI